MLSVCIHSFNALDDELLLTNLSSLIGRFLKLEKIVIIKLIVQLISKLRSTLSIEINSLSINSNNTLFVLIFAHPGCKKFENFRLDLFSRTLNFDNLRAD